MFSSLNFLIANVILCVSSTPVADHLDWREKGAVLPVITADCVSPTIVNALDAISALYQIQHNKLIKLSYQQVYDCDADLGCPCGGTANASQIYKSIFDERLDDQIDSELSYPFTGQCTKVCQFNKTGAAVTFNGFQWEYDDVIAESMLYSLIAKSPVVVGVNAGVESFQMYTSGIYDNEECTGDVKDHTLLLVGYGTQNGTDYWIARNTWGTNWGEKGYIRIVRDKNMCGIGSGFAQPILVS